MKQLFHNSQKSRFFRKCYNSFMTENLVSIIVPLYNSEKSIKKTVDSLLKQTYPNLEFILVDDGSTDKSGEIIDELQKKDARIVTVHQANQGQSSARNAGIRMARGEFVCFVDSDDTIGPDYALKLVNAIGEDNGLAVVGMNYHRVKQNTNDAVYTKKLRKIKKNESIKAYILYLLAIDGRMYSAVNKIFRKDIIVKNNLEFPAGLNFGEDTRFVLSYLAAMNGEIVFVPEALYTYNSGSETSTVKKSGVEKANWQALLKDLKAWVGKKPSMSERFWLKMVALRWKISYHRTKKRAKTS